MKKFLPLIFTVVVSAPAVAAAQAQDSTDQLMSREHFEQLDTDKSGTVSRAEYQEFMEKAFASLDADGSGGISQVEAEKVLVPEQVTSMDTNGDGQLSQQEFMTQVMADFDQHDRNRDGQLSYP